MKKLEETKINSKLYRKVNFENIANSGEVCCSTTESGSLISHGEMCLVFEKKERKGFYFFGDADAGKNFGYDEFRTELDIYEELPYIVYPNSWDEEIDEKDSRYDTEEDPFIWIDNLKESGLGQVISESEYKKLSGDEINFNF